MGRPWGTTGWFQVLTLHLEKPRLGRIVCTRSHSKGQQGRGRARLRTPGGALPSVSALMQEAEEARGLGSACLRLLAPHPGTGGHRTHRPPGSSGQNFHKVGFG